MRSFRRKLIQSLAAWLAGAAIGAGSVVVFHAVGAPRQTTESAPDEGQPAPPNPPPTGRGESATPDVSGVEFVTNRYKEEDQSLHCEIEAAYPQIARPTTKGERAFNHLLKSTVLDEVMSLQREIARHPRTDADLPETADELRRTCEVLFARPEIVSVQIDEYGYSWPAAHGWNASNSVTFDLRAGRELALRELFLPRSNYLDVIAQYCARELATRGPEIACWPELAAGVKPIASNYRTWNVTTEGLLVTFGECQVGPHSVGQPSVVVPYERLRAVIDPRGPLAPLLESAPAK